MQATDLTEDREVESSVVAQAIEHICNAHYHPFQMFQMRIRPLFTRLCTIDYMLKSAMTSLGIARYAMQKCSQTAQSDFELLNNDASRMFGTRQVSFPRFLSMASRFLGDCSGRYDIFISMRNLELLLYRVASWIVPAFTFVRRA